jgi:CRP-like cAMP-binding protein
VFKPDQADKARAVVKEVPLFKGVKEELLQALVAGLEMRNFAKGKVIMMEQEISNVLYILAEGNVSVSRRERGEKRLLATLKAPDCFGERSMITQAPANALVKAEDACQVFILSRANFIALLQVYRDFGARFRKNLEVLNAERPGKVVRPQALL